MKREEGGGCMSQSARRGKVEEWQGRGAKGQKIRGKGVKGRK